MNIYWLKRIRKHYEYTFVKDSQKQLLVKNKVTGKITEWKQQCLFIDWWCIVNDKLILYKSLTSRLNERSRQNYLRWKFKQATL